MSNKYVTIITKNLDNLNKIGAIVEKAFAENNMIQMPVSLVSGIRNLVNKEINTGELVPEDVLPREVALDLIRRLYRHREIFGHFAMSYNQFTFPKEIEDQIMDLLPDEVKKQKIKFSVQHFFKGKLVPMHIDDKRHSSLFYVLSKTDMKTVWYKKIDESVPHNIEHPIDPDQYEKDYEQIMEQHVWYLINQDDCHSAHRLKPDVYSERWVFLVEFNELYYPDSLKLLD
jgi:hypothetical protein